VAFTEGTAAVTRRKEEGGKPAELTLRNRNCTRISKEEKEAKAAADGSQTRENIAFRRKQVKMLAGNLTEEKIPKFGVNGGGRREEGKYKTNIYLCLQQEGIFNSIPGYARSEYGISCANRHLSRKIDVLTLN
jgi:hypothetical protein